MGWKGKKVLVTGGAGFIGSWVVKKLLERGAEVRVVDNLSKGDASNLADVMDQIEFIKGDLLKKKIVERCMRDVDFCFHFAARIGGIGYFHKYPAEILRDNSIMTLNLWDAATQTKPKMVGISSSMVFERAFKFPTPESHLNECPPPFTAYGFSKLFVEYVARAYYEQFSVPYVIARPFNVYGPGETPGEEVGYSHVIPDLVKKILSGQYPLEILGSGEQTRSFTYVEDAADAIIFIAEKAEQDDFNIGTGVETSIKELAYLLWRICGRKEPIKLKHLPAFEHDVKRRVPDVSKLFSLGWRPKVSLEQGLKVTVEWLREKLRYQ